MAVVDTLLEPREEDAREYAALHATVRETLERLQRANTFSRSCGHVQGLLLRLRMAACHSRLARDAIARLHAHSGEARRRAEASNVPELSTREVLDGAKSKPILHRWLGDLLAPLEEEGGVAECAICLDEMQYPTLTPCERPVT